MNLQSTPVLLPRIKQMHSTSGDGTHGSLKARDGTDLGTVQNVPLFIPLWADLALWVVIDVGSHFEPIMDNFRADNPHVSDDHLIALVARNMTEQAEITVQGDPGTLVMAVCGGNFEATQIINPAFWDAIHNMFTGDVVVALPTPDMCMIADAANNDAVSKLVSVANQVYTNPTQTSRTSDGLYRKSPSDSALHRIGRHSELADPATTTGAATQTPPTAPPQPSPEAMIDTALVPALFAAIDDRRQAELTTYFVEDAGAEIGQPVQPNDFVAGLAMAILRSRCGIMMFPGQESECESFCNDLVDGVVGRPDAAWDASSNYVHFTWSDSHGSVSDGLRAFDTWLQQERARHMADMVSWGDDPEVLAQSLPDYRLLEVGVSGIWLSILVTAANMEPVTAHLAALGIGAQPQSASTRP